MQFTSNNMVYINTVSRYCQCSLLDFTATNSLLYLCFNFYFKLKLQPGLHDHPFLVTAIPRCIISVPMTSFIHTMTLPTRILLASLTSIPVRIFHVSRMMKTSTFPATVINTPEGFLADMLLQRRLRRV